MDVGQHYTVNDEILAETTPALVPALARRGHVVQIVGFGGDQADQFVKLADDDGRPLPGWFRSTELKTTEEASVTMRTHVTAPRNLSQDIAAIRSGIETLQARTSASRAQADKQILDRARQYATTHNLDPEKDLAEAMTKMSLEPENSALIAQWRSSDAEARTAPLPEDAELARLTRERVAEKEIPYLTALREVSSERVDLAERVRDAVHGTRGDDGSWARECAARDVELRRVSTDRVDLSSRTSPSERQAGAYKRSRR